MEDIPRELQKEIDKYKVPPSIRRGRQWTMLFIGERGEVITIRKFKGLLLLALFVMIVALAAAVSIYMLYKKPFEENRRLEAALATSEARVRALGKEKELLLTRLGIAESRAGKTTDPEVAAQQTEVGLTDTEEGGGEGRAAPNVLEPAPETVTSQVDPKPPEKPEMPEEPEAPATTDAAAPEIRVDVEDFQVRHDPDQHLLNVQFRLKNVNLQTGAVSGRTFVVLEDDQGDGSDILTFPRVTLVNGKPDQIHRGRYFSISRFNIVKFKSAYEETPRVFNRGTVFVYSGAGDLLLEKKFAIENPFTDTVTTEPEGSEDQTGAPEKSNGEPDRLVPNNTILNN